MSTLPPCGHGNGTHPSGCWYVAVADAVAAERARIRAAVEPYYSCRCGPSFTGRGRHASDCCAEVVEEILAVIDGGTP
jgi:hypothetical protein